MKGCSPPVAALAFLCWATVSAAQPRTIATLHSDHKSAARWTGLPGQRNNATKVSILRDILRGRTAAGVGTNIFPIRDVGTNIFPIRDVGTNIFPILDGSHHRRQHGGPWATATAGGRRRPAVAVAGGRWLATVAVAGGRWPAVSTAGGHGLHWPTDWPMSSGGSWARAGRWPNTGSPGRGHRHNGWGISIIGSGRRGCGHGGKHGPWPRPTTNRPEITTPAAQPSIVPLPEEPTETARPTAEPTEEPRETAEPTEQPWETAEPTEEPWETAEPTEEPDEYEGSADYPDEPSEPPAATEVTPEKEDCAEGAVFLDGDCVCRDPSMFLDTILERCVDTQVTIY